MPKLILVNKNEKGNLDSPNCAADEFPGDGFGL